MESFLLCLASGLTLSLAGSVDHYKCDWHWGGYGDTITCLSGMVGMGACGSGKKGDCRNGAYTGLQCCALVGDENSGDVTGPYESNMTESGKCTDFEMAAGLPCQQLKSCSLP